MTVCVAAICDNNVIVGASDRMLTAGDIQFEPNQPKVTFVSNSIAIMFSGDAGVHGEIIQRVLAEVQLRIRVNADDWWRVSDVANLYARHCAEITARSAELAILRPLGLTWQSWMSQQATLSPSLVNRIATELVNFKLDDVHVIVTGVDVDGAHIYVVQNTVSVCHDIAGFAAVGAGYWHADSQMMFAGHRRANPFPDTILLVFTAKKRAEVAPGVGSGTDMFLIGPGLGRSLTEIGAHVLDELTKITNNENARRLEAAAEALKGMQTYAAKLAESAPVEKQQVIPAPTDDDGESSANDKAVSRTELEH